MMKDFKNKLLFIGVVPLILALQFIAPLFVAQLTCGWEGYLQTRQAFEGKGYRGYSAMVNKVGPVGEQILVNETVRSINELFNCPQTTAVGQATNKPANGNGYFNTWLTTCSHLIGPSGNPNSLKHAVEQSKGRIPPAPGFEWDILIDLGDWTASQLPPGDEEGIKLAKCLNESLGKDRGRFFTLAGNHDGDPKGWPAGKFTNKYVNLLGEPEYEKSSGFSAKQRQPIDNISRILEYPGTRWDRYLIGSGNVIWIMLSDRNEFDSLAESRGDKSSLFQAGRGSASGMPNGGYPSGAVTLNTFEWWKKVVEDPAFKNNILITAHHILPCNTTVGTKEGEIWRDNPEQMEGETWNKVYHGKSGSVGPKGSLGGQLYWIREYDNNGKEINQYAQTRPFLNYLKDHPGAIAAWLGGHTHVDSPESEINGRGIYVKKYGVTFINTGALTDTHGEGVNQMSRLLTFQDGSDKAIINVYIHQSKTGIPLGWCKDVVRKFPLGKKFECPPSTTNIEAPFNNNIKYVSDAPEDEKLPRFCWNLNADHFYDFNNSTHVVGEDGSPYGIPQGIENVIYSEDTPSGKGKSLDLRAQKGRVLLNAPYQPEMNWSELTLRMWIKTFSSKPQEVISYSSSDEVGKFRLWFNGKSWIWDVGEGRKWCSARWHSFEINNDNKWHYVETVADGKNGLIQLWVNGKLVAEKGWASKILNPVGKSLFVIGASGDHSINNNQKIFRPFNGLVDEIKVFDSIKLTDRSEYKNSTN